MRFGSPFDGPYDEKGHIGFSVVRSVRMVFALLNRQSAGGIAAGRAVEQNPLERINSARGWLVKVARRLRAGMFAA